MTRKVILIPIGKNIDLTSVSLNVSNFFIKNNINFSFWNPFVETNNLNNIIKNSSYYLKKIDKSINFIKPIFLKKYSILLKKKKYSFYLEKLLDRYNSHNIKKFVLIEGITFFKNISTNFFNQLNLDISRILNASIIFVITPENNFFEDFRYKFHFINSFFLQNTSSEILGVFINSHESKILTNLKNNFLPYSKEFKFKEKKDVLNSFFNYKNIPILGICSFYKNNFSIKLDLFMKLLFATPLFFLNKKENIIKLIIFFEIKYIKKIDSFNKNTLLIICSNDLHYLEKIFINTKIKINFFVLCIGNNKSYILNSKIYKIFKKNKVSIFFKNINIINLLFYLNHVIDVYKKKNIKEIYKKNISTSCISTNLNSIFLKKFTKKNFSLYKFLYQLKKLSKQERKTIILPEGENKKIIQAVYLCYKLKLCNCIILGNLKKIYKKFLLLGLSVPKKLKIYDPKDISKKYIKIYKNINNSLSINECKKILAKNTIILSMLMLITDKKYNGVVAGIINTTANVIRPALKIVKMKNNTRLISSIFFMLFPDKVLIYGDCAININPTAVDLSEIAIQSAESAKIFKIVPKIAMLSYSTKDSGSGEMVDKVKIATELVRKKRPDLIVEGPIQYDAATNFDISKIKFKNSKILGDANIFIFPDLNSGNITYKAVQRTCFTFSLGPMIQGLKKPVNDLSRGASVDDILYTIALTAVQSIKY
ncbi:Phosphate acetyltransferase [Buchnera aphidicola (Periphyllus testudinaceus)]|uniref:phosphate acetyltransferase n=1 Tax=Buchnera aphidicola TaxID=9 RepID=UPI0034638592